ncbi:unnamed protein product [Rotaria sp. Silwood1]|nr:unnamed protein product [Rotaria sp. Silwood1]
MVTHIEHLPNELCSTEILNRIISLQWIAKPRYGYLPQFFNKNISEFTRLRALRIEIHPRQTSLICKIFSELNSLEYLSVKSVTIHTLLIETIFTIPCLHICELINSHVMRNIECSFVRQKNLINDGWSIVEQIEKVNISIRLSKQINTVDIQKKFITYHNMLVSKINQSNKSCKIKWTQTECPLYKFCAEINTLK